MRPRKLTDIFEKADGEAFKQKIVKLLERLARHHVHEAERASRGNMWGDVKFELRQAQEVVELLYDLVGPSAQ